MKRDPVDFILQLAFLEGKINTHGLYEQTVARRKVKKGASIQARRQLLTRLEGELSARKQAREVPLTIGAYLKSQSVPASEISARLGLTETQYRKLEDDSVSPLRISVETWKKLRQFFGLSAEVMGEMIRRTHQLVFFQPSFRTTLARYKERKGKGKKAKALQMAARELYAKAKLSLPEEEERKLSELLKAISE